MLPQDVSLCESMHQPWPQASSLSNQKQLPQHLSSFFAISYLNLMMKTSLFNHSSGHMPFCGFPMDMLSIFFSTACRSLA